MSNLDKTILALFKEGHLTDDNLIEYFRFRFQDRPPYPGDYVYPFPCYPNYLSPPYKVTCGGDDTDLSITSTPSEWLIGNIQ